MQQSDTRNNGISNVDVETYSKHIQELRENMKVRLQDVFPLEIPDWVIDPFINISEQEILAEELTTLQNDFELTPKFSVSYQLFWLQSEIKVKYPYMSDWVKIFFIAFPSSYLVECAFNAITVLLDNLITEETTSTCAVRQADLRLFLTKIKPNIKKLMKLHQAHPSH